MAMMIAVVVLIHRTTVKPKIINLLRGARMRKYTCERGDVCSERKGVTPSCLILMAMGSNEYAYVVMEG